MKTKFSTKIFETVEELGEAVAKDILQDYKQKGRLVVGIPWGTTPVPVFNAFANIARNHAIKLSGFHLVVMDEYIVKSASGYSYVDELAQYSGHYHLNRDLFEKLPEKQALQLRNNTYFPKPENPNGFDEFIKRKLGGVDIFLIAVGAHDGHVAMNGPGTEPGTRTRVVRIPETVRSYNFEKMGKQFNNNIENVPRFGISVGLETILDSQKLLFVAFGGSKTKIVKTFFDAGDFDIHCPITFLWVAAEKTVVYLDKETAAGIK